jgi:UDP-glucose 4-epimerase
MARILITGASGFIGGHLVALAVAEGHDVVAAIRSGSDTTRIKDTGARLLELDFSAASTLSKQLKAAGQFDHVIHNAGVTKAFTQQDYLDGNLNVTVHFVEAIKASGYMPKSFLLVSSLAALGSAPDGQERVRADQNYAPLTQYGTSKKVTEEWLKKYASDLPWVIARPTAVYGPAERDILQYVKMLASGIEVTAGSKDQKLSFIYGPDAAQALLALAQTPHAVGNTYILSDGYDYTAHDLTKATKAALGRSRVLSIQLPIWLISQVAAIVETLGKWQGKQTPLNRDKVAELSAKNWLCDSRNLFADTSFKPKHDLHSGMRETVRWYREQGWI